MLDDQFEVVAYQHPLKTSPADRRHLKAHEGATVSEIVRQVGIDPRFLMDVEVVISRGTNSSVVPLDAWDRVRPREGSHVLVVPKVRGAVIGLLLSAALPSFSTFVAGSVFGLTAGTLGYAAVTAAVTIIGSLAINALISPPTKDTPRQDAQNYTITGSSNVENRYGVIPTVLGRHRMFPPKLARGYTEGVGDDIYFRGLFTFGYGPVAIEDLRIGDIPITEFKNVQIEFLNVDYHQTIARMPSLSGLQTWWRYGDHPMGLYPHDIAESPYSFDLRSYQPQIVVTRDRSISASVDLSYPGLVFLDNKGRKHNIEVVHQFRYRKRGTTAWVQAGETRHNGATTASIRRTHWINFPAPDEYEIEVMRLSWNGAGNGTDGNTFRDDSFLTAVRSVRAHSLPSHPDVSKIAVRIKASEQLNGQLNTLNAIVQQMAPIWDGNAWTAPQPVRHPAWIYARALTGPMMSRPVSGHRLQISEIRDWALEEPHWTCDAVIDQPTRVAEVLDLICATGRASRTMRDLKYSIIRDGGAGPVVQQFNPHNSWGFQGTITFPKEIHGFRVRFISEQLDWQQDELVVYADGYGPHNATEFEVLDLHGVVLTKSDSNGGNPWRLGRYHLAQVILRPESFSWNSDMDHLKAQRGDKVRLVHDVPLIGVGSGRVASVGLNPDATLKSLTLDNLIKVEDGDFRIWVRRAHGGEVLISATPPVSSDGLWTVKPGQYIDAALITNGDLVSVELMTQETMEVLIQRVEHNGEEKAVLTGVPAAPEVLQADQGAIPAYVPNITNVKPRETLLPSRSVVSSAASVVLYGPARVVARIEIAEHDRFETMRYHVSLIDPAGNERVHGPFVVPAFDIPLDSFGVHRVLIRRENASGMVSPAQEVDADWSLSLTQPDDVIRFRADVVGSHATLTWAATDPLAKHYEVRYLATGNAGGWAQAVVVAGDVQGGAVTVPLLGGRYLVRAIGHWDQKSANAASVTISDNSVHGLNLVKTLTEHPAFDGEKTKNLVAHSGRLYLTSDLTLNDWPALSEVGKISTFRGVAPLGEYQLSEVVDLGAVYTSRLTADIEASEFLSDFRLSSWPKLSAVETITGSVSDEFWGVRLMMQLTLGDPDAAGSVWSDWEEFRAGDYEARAYRFKLLVESRDPKVQVVVNKVALSIDMPDRVDGERDVVCPVEGVQVQFNPPFREPPAIAITGQELPSGFVEKRTQVSAEGFHMQFVDSSGLGVACTFDWVAKGYGRKI